jgi:hypothetical protein
MNQGNHGRASKILAIGFPATTECIDDLLMGFSPKSFQILRENQASFNKAAIATFLAPQ